MPRGRGEGHDGASDGGLVRLRGAYRTLLEVRTGLPLPAFESNPHG
jgi:hypothetical protein